MPCLLAFYDIIKNSAKAEGGLPGKYAKDK